MTAEKRFENKVKEYLTKEGAYFIKYWGGGIYTKDGVPDLICCVNGYSLWIELKAPKGKPSELQIYHRDLIRKAGGIAIILYPDQFEDFKNLIECLKLLENPAPTFVQYTFDRG